MKPLVYEYPKQQGTRVLNRFESDSKLARLVTMPAAWFNEPVVNADEEIAA
jgi:hypothetical protein